MKRCPYCAEEIQELATVCRFCSRDLSQTASPAKSPGRYYSLTSPKGCFIVVATFLGVPALLLGLISLLDPDDAPSAQGPPPPAARATTVSDNDPQPVRQPSRAPKSKPAEPTKQSSRPARKVQSPADLIRFGKPTVTDLAGNFYVHVEVTNEDSRAHTFSVLATFKAQDGTILGTATGVAERVAPNQTKTMDLVSTERKRPFSECIMQVDSMFE